MYQGTNRIIKPSYRNLIIVFVILAVILVGAILYFSLSQATITITPNYERQQVGFAIQIVNADIEANQDQQIPGFVKEVIIEDTKTFEAKQITTTESKASGKLTVYNVSEMVSPPVAFVATTVPDTKSSLAKETAVVNSPVIVSLPIS